MKRNILLILFLFIIYHLIGQQNTFFIATNGDDNNSGTIEKPLKSIQKVQDLLFKSNIKGDIIIYFREGIYSLDQTIIFKKNHHKENFNILFRSYNDEKVTISGSYKLSNSEWIQKGNVWELNVGKYKIPIGIRHFYINGKRCVRAKHKIKLDNISVNDDTTYYIIKSDTVLDHLSNVRYLELVTTFKYRSNRIKVDSIVKNKMYVNPENKVSVFHGHITDVEWIENAFEFLDQPDKWYYNEAERKIYYFSQPGENPNSSEINIQLPHLEKLLIIDSLSNITFENITFSYTTWTFPSIHGFNSIQASHFGNWKNNSNLEDRNLYVIPASIEVRYSSNILFKNCTFSHLGMDGISIDRGSKNCQIEECLFTDISSNAIRIGGIGGENPKNKLETSNITVNNCKIFNVACEYFSCVGIFIGYSTNISIIKNDIYDLPYTGIHMGWGWDDNTFHILGNNCIAQNVIHDVLLKLCDGGAIYNLGSHNPTSLIESNNIFNITSTEIGPRCGIYLDEGSCNINVMSNFGQKFDDYKNKETDYGNQNIFISKKTKKNCNLFKIKDNKFTY
jgi:hypothetical protein